MPVTNQWKLKSKEEAAAKAAEKKEPEPEPVEEPKGRLQNFKLKGKNAPAAKVEEAKPEEKDGAGDQTTGGNRAKNLANVFTGQNNETKVIKKKLFVVEDNPETIILENEPVERLEGVVRSDDLSEWQKPLELEEGHAKKLASRFLNRQDDENGGGNVRRPFQMDLGKEEIHESEPVLLEGVVRNADKTEDVIGKRGRIKNIAGKFANPSDDADKELDGQQDVPDARNRKKMGDRWNNQQDDETNSSDRRNSSAKPAWLVELENAKDNSGVYENEPEVRNDVVHADDDQPDVISVQHTRNLRKMWSNFEKEEMTNKEPKRLDIRPKKKEPSPEPEPPPKPEPKQDTRRIGGRRPIGRLAQKEPEPPAPVPEPEMPKGRGKLFQKQAPGATTPVTNPAAQKSPPLEIETKASKLTVKPALNKTVGQKKF